MCADWVCFVGHINNLYNTTFWTLIQQGGMDAKAAEAELAVSFLFFDVLGEQRGVLLIRYRVRWRRIRTRYCSRGLG